MAGPAAALLLMLIPGMGPTVANTVGGIATQVVPPLMSMFVPQPQQQGCCCQQVPQQTQVFTPQKQFKVAPSKKPRK